MPYDNTPLDEDRTEVVQPTESATSDESEPALWPVYAAIAGFLGLLVVSTLIFGLPGLYIPMVALVPVMYFLLIRISMG